MPKSVSREPPRRGRPRYTRRPSGRLFLSGMEELSSSRFANAVLSAPVSPVSLAFKSSRESELGLNPLKNAMAQYLVRNGGRVARIFIGSGAQSYVSGECLGVSFFLSVH